MFSNVTISPRYRKVENLMNPSEKNHERQATASAIDGFVSLNLHIHLIDIAGNIRRALTHAALLLRNDDHGSLRHSLLWTLFIFEAGCLRC